MSKFSDNNFDLIRLFAATQVAVFHTSEHLQVELHPLLHEFLRLFPGVPIFFFISGYLISKSFEKNSVLTEYFQNRALRIYPALIICVGLSALSVYILGYFQKVDVDSVSFIAWLMSQISFAQFYNPEFLRGYGVGVINGSLWTITVELQFYFLVPFLYKLIDGVLVKTNIGLFCMIVLFLLINRAYFAYQQAYSGEFAFKLLGVSFLPWFYMFLFGIFAQRNFDRIYDYLSGRSIYFLLIYSGLSYFLVNHMGLALGNAVSPAIYFLLSILIFSLAYSRVGLSDKILRRNDISYGVYIYHMPVVNAFIYLGSPNAMSFYLLALAVTISIAVLSWFYIEKPSIKLKRHPLNPFNSDKSSSNS